MIVRIIGGQKKIIADVSKVKSVNGEDGDVVLTAADIKMSKSETGANNNVRTKITSIDAELATLNTKTSVAATDPLLLQTPAGISSKPLAMNYNNGTLSLTTGATELASIGLGISSQLEYAGLVFYGVEGWPKDLGFNPPIPEAEDGESAIGTYLVIGYKGAAAGAEVVYTIANVSELLDDTDTTYGYGDGINLIPADGNVDAKFEIKIDPLSISNLSKSPAGLRFEMPVVPTEALIPDTAAEGSFWIVTSDIE